eukprot:CAMPEP_0115020268 /NCGR_PEP_ID=MMETSP0216-20121206/29986_1 /TAXON_ID=223996 /ORGANISM="Protocruzia adherens, Strain Boccale" /LENGTH=211 /DNA_ID=CAMNT_0002391993 /DNA_START=61 /DNA_END=696 /DNA_ORIENTATION=+
MKRLFGAKKKQEEYNGPTLNETSDHLDGRTKQLQVKVDECDVELVKLNKQLKASRGSSAQMVKQRMLGVLKRKKMYTSQLNATMGQQFNVEQLNFASQNVQDTINTVSALKAGVNAQKAAMKGLNIDNIQDQMDDLHDLMEDQEEINDIMSRNYGVEEYDEADLDEELAELDNELLDEAIVSGEMKSPSYLPGSEKNEGEEIASVPNKEIV